MTVKTRITLFIVAAGVVSSLLFSIVVFFELIEQPFELLDSELKKEAHRAVRMIVKNQEAQGNGYAEFLSEDLNQLWIKITDKETNRTVFHSRLAGQVELSSVKPGDAAIVSIPLPGGKTDLNLETNREAPFRVRTFPIRFHGRSFLVQIARPMEELGEEIQEIVLIILSGLVFSTLALIAISGFVTRKILQPIGQMKDLTEAISEKNLDRRIPAGEGQDEFSRLGRTINRMLDRLQNSFVRQREFLYDTSHELKTPLTTMRLAVDDICATGEEELPPRMRDKLLRLNTQVLRMERLVKDLLKLSALEALTGLDRDPVELATLLSSLAEDYQFLAEANHITMEVRLPEQLGIHGDAEKLNRAFSNILDNAVKYNAEGGRIELTGEQSATDVTIFISNTGPGVSEAEIPKVFDQFYRVEKSRSIEHGGSGLGLAIVKNIVELHGGTVEFESRMNDRTRVTVRLPRHQ